MPSGVMQVSVSWVPLTCSVFSVQCSVFALCFRTAVSKTQSGPVVIRKIPFSNVSSKALLLWYALVCKANAGTFAVGTFWRPSRLSDVNVTLATDVSAWPAGAVCRVPGRCG
jgi:hypothetical protein